MKTNEPSDLQQQVRILGDDLKELSRATKDALQERAVAAKDAGVAALEKGKDTIEQYREKVESATREQPIKSVLVAAGVGAVLGILLARR
ncbi:MAG TPA: hypothetical protein PKE00_01380 [Planctomycetota bacterium]|nr:hypothetical protein [Planctomycetota bacterium]